MDWQDLWLGLFLPYAIIPVWRVSENLSIGCDTISWRKRRCWRSWVSHFCQETRMRWDKARWLVREFENGFFAEVWDEEFLNWETFVRASRVWWLAGDSACLSTWQFRLVRVVGSSHGEREIYAIPFHLWKINSAHVEIILSTMKEIALGSGQISVCCCGPGTAKRWS